VCHMALAVSDHLEQHLAGITAEQFIANIMAHLWIVLITEDIRILSQLMPVR